MNASQDTKYGPSVVAETLRSLSDHAKVCHEKIDLLKQVRASIEEKFSLRSEGCWMHARTYGTRSSPKTVGRAGQLAAN